MRTKHKLSILLLAVSAGLIGWFLLMPGVKKPNIILVSADTLRADHLSIYGHDRETCPEIKKLADRSFVFKAAYTPRGETVPSLASLLTGLYPGRHGLQGNEYALPNSVPTLTDALKNAGYETMAVIANPVIKGSLLTRDFEKTVYTNKAGEAQWQWDDRAAAEARAFLEKPRAKPFFLWVHLMDPHSPFQAGPEEKGRFARGEAGLDGSRKQLIEITRSGERFDREDRAEVRALYDEEVAGTDRRVGQIMAAMDKRKLSENTMVLFLSDHGEELGDHHNYFFHSISVYRQVLHVPLVWHLPDAYRAPLQSYEDGKAGKAVFSIDAAVSLIDITPTLAAVAGVALPDNLTPDGLDLSPLFDGKSLARRSIFTDFKNKIFGAIQGNYHYISNPQGLTLYTAKSGSFPGDPDEQKAIRRKYGRLKQFTVPKEALFDITADPLSQKSIAPQNPDLCKDMAQDIKAFRQSLKAVTAGRISEEAQKELKRIGY